MLLADVGAGDPAVLCAALLHDTLEDTQTTLVERRERFGEEVAGPADWPLARKREYFEWAKAVANRMRGTLPVHPNRHGTWGPTR
ncbi:hypothetical protein [Roseomonas genomospecies 6]|uniref:hypothetical protein n=1 Tax=Roseomonas genomospecies 6 TaxID=214106 RepID=UPI00142F1106|nr:hypothetical protein [Roseomonas genomospecies 6]